MAGKKTAAKNTRNAKKSASSARNANSQFIVPCNGGLNAYVLHPVTYLNPNLATASAEFAAAVGEVVAAGHGAKITAEIVALASAPAPGAWPGVLARLRAEAVLV